MIEQQLRELGLGKDDVVMVHASMRKVGCDVNELVRALVETAGTVMAYVDWQMDGDDDVFDPKALDTITLLRFSEHVAALPEKRVTHYERCMSDGRVVAFEELETSEPVSATLPADHDFAVSWLERHGK